VVAQAAYLFIMAWIENTRICRISRDGPSPDSRLAAGGTYSGRVSCAAVKLAHSGPSLGACSMPWACQSPKLTPEPCTFQSLRPFAVRPSTTAAAALGLANTWSRANRIALPSWPGTIAPSWTSFSRKTLYACSTPVQASLAPEPSSTMNSPSISLAAAEIPSLFKCSSKTGEEMAAEADADSATRLTAAAVERRMFTPRTGRMILAWADEILHV